METGLLPGISGLLSWTCKYLTYKEWKHVLCKINYFHIISFCGVSTLPIRNGNILWQTYKGKVDCKYLTYKEWKQFYHNILLFTVLVKTSSLLFDEEQMCKYLTYKEWKLILLSMSSESKGKFT